MISYCDPVTPPGGFPLITVEELSPRRRRQSLERQPHQLKPTFRTLQKYIAKNTPSTIVASEVDDVTRRRQPGHAVMAETGRGWERAIEADLTGRPDYDLHEFTERRDGDRKTLEPSTR